ncbi:hypothetical protein BB560_002665 [Smittium megazygosporum]|uniref:Xaa-Pro aminopeptidase P n=1 Tax=Smittium megazygosporum TaxID=133381 RepID=A0A2T9ZE56_9FUNG|nr:hypothetical protein BB560_002665 [Smittium megazygosporum]
MFISGFTGSLGHAVITKDNAYMFTDGRYYLQARGQMDKNWTLVEGKIPLLPIIGDFLSKLPAGTRVGVDPRLVSASEANEVKKQIAKNSIELVPVEENFIDTIWNDQPARNANIVFHHSLKYSGKPWTEKVEEVRQALKEQSAVGLIVSALDQIAWLLNLRGSDVKNNPVFFAYAVVTMDNVALFIDDSRLSPEARESIKGVEIKKYESVFTYLKELGPVLASKQQQILADYKTSWALVDAVGEEKVIFKLSPIDYLKGIKNSVEIEGMKIAHIKDGVAMAKFYSWLENELIFNGGHMKLSECDAADKLDSLRMEQENAFGQSFHTISGTGANAAVIHYSPVHGSDAKIDVNKIYLNDSGGQYFEGTTDVTRSWHFGTPTEWERECFTRVLKGFIALNTIVFPEGTTGYVLDTVARQYLWEAGLDFQHGTGHGVGSFLNVHEGPFGIAFRPYCLANKLDAGNMVSNEPGYYEPGNFGVRIEDICVITKAKTKRNFAGVQYLKLESITYCPIQTKLIMTSLLTTGEIKYINDYHKSVWDKISPLIEDNEMAYNWLKRNTSPI